MSTPHPSVMPPATAVVTTRTLPVLCKPVVPHKLKMFAKKTLRKLFSHSDGWRELVDAAQQETKDATTVR